MKSKKNKKYMWYTVVYEVKKRIEVDTRKEVFWKMDGAGEEEEMKPWEQHSSVIRLPRFDYNAPSSLLTHPHSAFLITCTISKSIISSLLFLHSSNSIDYYHY